MGKKNTTNNHFKIMVWCILLATFLVLIVPLLINLSYSLPIIIIFTHWNASDVLAFYGSLLEICATIGTFAFSVYLALVQIRHEQEMQKELKTWEEIESIIDLCIDDIHPYKLKYASLNVIPEKDVQNAYKLISHVYAYGITTRISVDKMERSMTKTGSSELSYLIADITAVSKKLIDMANKYYHIYQDAYIEGLKSLSEPDPKRTAKCLVNFAETVNCLETSIENLYLNDFLGLYHSKTDFFQKKYDDISRKKPKFFWAQKDSKVEDLKQSIL